MCTPWPLPHYIKKIQQHPAEVLEFIKFIREANIRSYCEIGCKFGGLLWTVAHAMPRKGRVVAVDLPHGHWGRPDSEAPLRECIAQLGREGFDAHLLLGDSTDQKIIDAVKALAPFDLLFIDANHTETYVRSDFTNYGRMARYCCFHDIGWNNPTVPGKLPIEVPQVWKEIKEKFNDQAGFREIKHDHGHNGIGILKWQ